jgi:hypothetical protein
MDVRFTANGQRAFSLPGCATLAAIHSVLTTGALVAPGLRIRRMLRQLSGATGTCDVVEPSGAVGSRRCVHGEGWILGGADGSEGFGKAETETRRTRRGCGFPRFCNLFLAASSVHADWCQWPAEADGAETKPHSRSISHHACVRPWRSTHATALHSGVWTPHCRQLFGWCTAARSTEGTLNDPSNPDYSLRMLHLIM